MSRSRETEYGKGDDDRTEDHEKFREGFEKIDWSTLLPEKEEGVETLGVCICPRDKKGNRTRTSADCPRGHFV